MNKVKNLRDIVRYWTEKSKESLDKVSSRSFDRIYRIS